jgi:hypothetical protein
MKQSRAMSLVESVTNVVVGYVLAIATQIPKGVQLVDEEDQSSSEPGCYRPPEQSKKELIQRESDIKTRFR